MIEKHSDSPGRNQRENTSKAKFVSIIDDEESVRRAVGSLVRSIGYSAETFGSAEEFLAAEPNLPTLCVISDIKMPGMDGIELYRHLRELGKKIPFIFITGFADESVQMKLGDKVDILEKPFSADKLANFLEQAGA